MKSCEYLIGIRKRIVYFEIYLLCNFFSFMKRLIFNKINIVSEGKIIYRLNIYIFLFCFIKLIIIR